MFAVLNLYLVIKFLLLRDGEAVVWQPASVGLVKGLLSGLPHKGPSVITVHNSRN